MHSTINGRRARMVVRRVGNSSDRHGVDGPDFRRLSSSRRAALLGTGLVKRKVPLARHPARSLLSEPSGAVRTRARPPLMNPAAVSVTPLSHRGAVGCDLGVSFTVHRPILREIQKFAKFDSQESPNLNLK